MAKQNRKSKGGVGRTEDGYIPLKGLRAMPSQVWRSLRLVPLVRDAVPGDIRLGLRKFDEGFAQVSLSGDLFEPDEAYFSYVPHAFVVNYSRSGETVASQGTTLQSRDGKTFGKFARVMHRMARQESRNRLRLLPLHLAMEGFLNIQFGGPDVAWEEYSRQALSRGLSPRMETTVPGREIAGLAEALGHFEIHSGQVGLQLFAAEELAAVFVVSHPDDYRQLHYTLLEDFFGDLIFHHARIHDQTTHFIGAVQDEAVASLSDLRGEVDRLRRERGEFYGSLAAGLLQRSLQITTHFNMGPFRLVRFLTDPDPARENHIGEAIQREDGTLEYLKSFRLSTAQTKRAYLLQQLAARDWNIQTTAQALGASEKEFMRRLDKAGFGYLLKEHVLRAARRR